MSTPILATKLFIPTPRPNLILRQHLIERLNGGLQCKLILVSAPAGFGKTTLVSSWIQRLGEAQDQPARQPSATLPTVAWLSLDERDNEPMRFLTYLVAAIQRVAPMVGKGTFALLQSPQLPSSEFLLTTLLNEVIAHPDPLVVVLDDYHLVDAKAVDELLTFLLDHLPPHLHLVITTREDPQLPLARLRARNQLLDVRAADLRLTAAEAAIFLNQVMGLALDEEQILALERRTEGWIAGLQLAALSMRGRADVTGFIKAFAGDNHYIVDYLIEEVLLRQPPEVRTFLLHTAILDHLTGALCDAVTEQRESAQRLEALERGNLFVIPLDDKRHWYRYHHLFADVLQAYLLQQQPEVIPLLHQRASIWYEQNAMLAAAIPHALAATDFVRAAHLLELAWPAIHSNSFQSPEFLNWMKVLPAEFVRARPVLSVGLAWELLDMGELEAAEQHLRHAEQWLGPITPNHEPTTAPTVSDEEHFRILPATIAVARAYLALSLGELSRAVQNGQRALTLLPPEDFLRRGQAAALLGLAYWASEDLESAYQSLAAGMDYLLQTGNVAFAISATYGLADIRITQGRLHDATAIYQRALQLAVAQGEPLPQGTAEQYLGLADLCREQGDLEAAGEYLQKSADLGESAALPTWSYRFRLAQARMKEIAGDLDGALALVEEAEHFYFRGPVPDLRPIAAQKVRVWLAQGRLVEALAWVRTQGVTVDDELSYLREFEHMTLARVLMARAQHEQDAGSWRAASKLLERLQQAAEAGERSGSLLEILVLHALVHAAQGERSLALAPLKRALILAEPEGYVRLFVDEGNPMAQLLTEALHRGIATVYVRKLLTYFPNLPASPTIDSALRPSSSALIEPLSERELEVLHLIAQGLSNQEISERLFLALSTVKGHNRVIFDKLQVQRRTEAVARARELGLV